jgi:SPW repeat
MATRTSPSPTRGVSTPRGNWRADVKTISRLNVLAGIWLVVSPFLLAYGGGDAVWNPIACGVVVALLGYLRVSGEYSESWLSWTSAVVGVWLFISGFWLADSARAEWNSLALGALVFLFSTASASASKRPPPPQR